MNWIIECIFLKEKIKLLTRVSFKLKKEKQKCIEFGSLTTKKFEDAEEYGLDIFSADSDPEHYFSKVIYRNKEGNFTDDDKFFEEPETVSKQVKFKITDNLKPVYCSVFICTEYKKRYKNSTDPVTGDVVFEITSFINDKVIDVILTKSDPEGNKSITKTEHGSYSINDQLISIDWGWLNA